MEDKSLYRETALEKLASPEQLDRLMTITRPTGWLALAGIGIVLITALIWSIWGSIPTKIYGNGILIREGGVQHITPFYSGHLSDIRIKEGDFISKGQVMARLYCPELENELVSAHETLKDLIQEAADTSTVEKMEKELAAIRENYLRKTRIISPEDGRVLEVMKKEGNFISANEPLASFEIVRGETRQLDTLLFIPAEQGQKILPGMDVQVNPLMVSREKYGFIIGKVISVSDYPISPQGIMNLLENEELVRVFSAEGAPVLVRVDLTPDTENTSGYKWSAGDGPPTLLDSGTLITAAVVVDIEPPINKVIPLLD